MTKIRIGISGWTYPDWRGSFYPDHVTIKNELQFASRAFNSIEVNGTFYSLQKPKIFEKWHDETPAGFSFAIKAPKYVTHERRLKDVATPVANFFASGILALKDKLGPILWQLPPHLPYDVVRIKAFLEMLPHTTKDALKVAKNHSDWMAERCYLETDADRPLRHAIEVRHHSYVNDEFLALMREHKVAIVIGDTAGKWPLIEHVTGSTIYIRLHGDEEMYPKGYTKPALRLWSEKILKLAAKVESLYAFCDSDYKIAAPFDARHLMDLMAIDWKPQPADIVKQAITAKPAAVAKAAPKTSAKATAKPKPPAKKTAMKSTASAANNSTVRKATRKASAKDKTLDKRRKVA